MEKNVLSEEKIDLGPFLKTQFGEFFLHPVNRNDFVNARSSQRYVEEWGERIFSEDTFNVIIGTDSGNLVNYIKNHELSCGSRYIFVELDDVLARLGEVCDAKNLDDRIHLVSYAQLGNIFEKLGILDYFTAEKVRLFPSLSVQYGYLPEYRELNWKVQQDLNQIQFELSAKFGNETFIDCQMKNLAENRVQAGILKNAFKGKTAVLLAAGPSLDDFLPWVKKNRDRIVVLTVSRISRRLFEYGISPDLVFSVDPKDVSFTVSKEILKFSDSAILVNAFHVAPCLLGQWPGKNLYVGTKYPWEQPSGDHWIPSRGPTVTHSALEVAVQFGFSRVFLAGVDLCLSKEGFTHAKGSAERDSGPLIAQDHFRVETYSGEPAEAPPGYFLGIKALALQAHDAAAKGVQIYNINPFAARIEGIPFLRAEDIRMDEEQVSASETIARFLPQSSSTQRKLHYEEILAELDRVENDLNKMDKLALNALDCNARLFGRKGGKANFKYKKKMDKIEETLNSEFPGISQWVKLYSTRKFIKMPRGLGGRQWSEDEIEKAGEYYYDIYRKTIIELKAILHSSRERILDRAEEEENNVDWDRVFQRWDADGQPGRSRVWRTRNPESFSVLPQEIQRQFVALEKKLENSLYESDKSFRGRVNEWDMSNLRVKALVLFHGQDRALLHNLVNYLDGSKKEVAKVYHALAQGYLAELNGEFSLALEFYNALISDDAPVEILEDSLKRILVISLNQKNIENSLLALDCLSAISPMYQKKYAEMLRITGKLDQAIAVYSDYLPKVPGDLNAMVKLGKVYLQAGQPEAARLAASNILSKDAENREALALLDEIDNIFRLNPLV